jgi:hypothetical protein
VQDAQPAVLRTEVVSPHGHAVSLVDGEQRDARAIEEVEEPRREEPLRRDVEEIELTGREGTFRLACGAGIERRVEEPRVHTELPQRDDLVLHQCDQR